MNDDTVTIAEAYRIKRLIGLEVDLTGMSRREAMSQIYLHTPGPRWKRQPPSRQQEELLKRWGLWSSLLSRGQASKLIEETLARKRCDPSWLPPSGI